MPSMRHKLADGLHRNLILLAYDRNLLYLIFAF